METPVTRLPEHADAMSIALIASSFAPLLLLDEGLIVIAASDSFCRAFDLKIADVNGKPIAKLGVGEWDVKQLNSLLNATITGNANIDVYEMDLVRKGRKTRRLLVNAHILDYFEAESVRVVLSVTDVTAERMAAKVKDDLVREKQLLLQEIQHRVANSLQIIASVLLQSARTVRSVETRDHLHDAHNRVMSVAMLQKHLAATSVESVVLRQYFRDLCASIAASMISDSNRLSLTTNVDDSVVDPDASVSLGLIVTELIINSLKHAFADRSKQGSIIVDYHSEGSHWSLTVTDDGSGMPKRIADRKPGLGTGIVEALAGQLGATVTTTNASPGTRVSIVSN